MRIPTSRLLCGAADHTPQTPACRRYTLSPGSYGDGMPIAIAYVLGVAPFLALGGGLFRLTRP
jgi:hypothetical protein